MAVTVRGTDILFNDGTTQSTAASASTYVGDRAQIYSTAGSYTFTIPAGVTSLKLTVVGGGGGSGPTAGGDQGGGNGAGGGAAISYLTGLTPGNTIAVTVGAAGTAGVWPSTNGGTGGTSSASSGTQTITTMSATGGAGGTVTGFTTPNLGGVGSGGTINMRGSPGFFAGSLMQGGSSALALGPAVRAYTNSNSIAGTFGCGSVGGWEGGSTVRNGSVGGAGVVMFEW